MTRLLIDEPPIAITPSLIRALGGHDLACFAQQVHYVALSRDGRDYDGHRWAVKTTEEWCEAVVLTPAQARRVIELLTGLGVLVRCSPPGYDRTAWSRIDEAAIASIRADASRGKQRDGVRGKGRDVPTPQEENQEKEIPGATASGPDELTLTGQPEPTPNQRANDLMRAWWRHVETETGKPPVAVSPAQFIKLVAPFFAAGYERQALKVAIAKLDAGGAPLTRQTIERELQGKGRPRGRQDVAAIADAMVFDSKGNLVTGGEVR